MADVYQTTFSNAFSSIGSDNGLTPSGDKPLSEPNMRSLLTHICVSRPHDLDIPVPKHSGVVT